MGCNFIFSIFFEELLYAATWLKLPKGWRARRYKRSLSCPWKLGFTFFFNFAFVCGFVWCHFQCDYSNLNMESSIFFKKFYKFHGIGVLSQASYQQKEFQFTHTYKSKGGIWATCTQFDLKMICKAPNKERRSTLFLLKVLVPCKECSWYKIVIMIFWRDWWSPTLPPKSKI